MLIELIQQKRPCARTILFPVQLLSRENRKIKLLSFSSYDEYVELQTETNKRKIRQVWVTKKELRCIATYIKKHIPATRLGICHGVRNGYEVAVLKELLGIDIIGTEISDSASQFENVIQWDYHKVKPEWINNVDFIYSNSWDHSFDPDLMLKSWMSSLKEGGRCFMAWTPEFSESAVKGADCFGIVFEEFKEWISKDYEIETIITIRKIYWRRMIRHPLRFMRKMLENITPYASKKTLIVVLKNSNGLTYGSIDP